MYYYDTLWQIVVVKYEIYLGLPLLWSIPFILVNFYNCESIKVVYIYLKKKSQEK